MCTIRQYPFSSFFFLPLSGSSPSYYNKCCVLEKPRSRSSLRGGRKFARSFSWTCDEDDVAEGRPGCSSDGVSFVSRNKMLDIMQVRAWGPTMYVRLGINRLSTTKNRRAKNVMRSHERRGREDGHSNTGTLETSCRKESARKLFFGTCRGARGGLPSFSVKSERQRPTLHHCKDYRFLSPRSPVSHVGRFPSLIWLFEN